MVNSKLNLDKITACLEGLEETIISRLIERAQYSSNACVYEAGMCDFIGESNKSLFELRMLHHENMDAQFGRFCVPEERPFTHNLPPSKRKVFLGETGLNIVNFNKVNVTGDIKNSYIELMPVLCKKGDDGQYGSSVELDIDALQAISRRVHYGALYVAECKYEASQDVYVNLIESQDTDSLMEQLTRKDVEEIVTARIYEKTVAAQASINELVRIKIDPDVVVNFYRDTIIPLTKKGEISYLLNRRKN